MGFNVVWVVCALAHVQHDKAFLATEARGASQEPSQEASQGARASQGASGTVNGGDGGAKAKAFDAVSEPMKAVINLTIQWFVLYTALAIVRSWQELTSSTACPDPCMRSGKEYSHEILGIIEAGCQTVNMAPMLCVLFLGVHMRALQLAQGHPEMYGLPQWWVGTSMHVCAYAVLVQTLIVLCLPMMLPDFKNAHAKEATTTTGSLDAPAHLNRQASFQVSPDGMLVIDGGSSWLVKGLVAVKYLSMLCVYAGFTAVCVGCFTMPAPEAVWPKGERCGVLGGVECIKLGANVSPAVLSTMILSAQYFAIYLALAILNTYLDFNGRTESATVAKVEGTLQQAKATVNFAPMLCILFIGARMRALQIDPVGGNPQRWAQYCFFLCCGSVFLQLVLICVTPLIMGSETTMVDTSYRMIDSHSPRTFQGSLSVLTVLRYLLLFTLYGGFTAVIVSVYTITDKQGNIPAVSPAMNCTMNLTVQYFLVYLLFFMCTTIKQFIESSRERMAVWVPTLLAAQKTVAFCPMLSVLFVGLRIRALQLTDAMGNPQGWAQQAMYLCTYAVLFQVMLVLVMPLVTGRPPSADRDGNVILTPRTKAETSYFAYVMVGLRYLCLAALYGGAVTCVVAIWTITPETADGTGMLLPGFEIPAPLSMDVLHGGAGTAGTGA